jgi:hypothetical protein
MTVLHKFSSALAGVGLALLQVASLPAHAVNVQQQGIQILDPSGVCASWNWGGTSLAPTVTCVAATPPGVPVCSITANNFNPLNISAAGLVALNATCTNTDANTTWAWTGPGVTSTTGPGVSSSQSLTVSSTATFGVIATNTTGPSVNKTVNVTVGAPPPPPPGGMDLTGCTAAGYVGRGLDVTFPATANTSVSNGALSASPSGTFGNADALVVRFTTPAAGVNDQSVFQPAGNPPSQNTSRVYTVSTKPCQFTTDGSLTGSILYTISSQSPAITVNIGACPYTGVYAPYCSGAYLQPSTTYYVTMVNRTTFGGAPSCSNGNCDMRIDFNK